jgi:hypothetical protein
VNELGDKLNAILDNPGQMEKIAQMAQSIMGGESRDGSAPTPKSGPDGIDPSMLMKLSALMSKSGVRDDKRALLEAMKPYLSEKRRKKLDNAMKLAKLAGIAEVAIGEFKLNDD